jgi:dUTP pyrophosphatase
MTDKEGRSSATGADPTEGRKTIAVPTEARDGFFPSYASGGSAGADLRADVSEAVTLEPGGRALIPTGVRLGIPAGYEGQVRPRSGLAVKHGVTILNGPGTIDADYRGEVKVALVNLGTESYTINRGDRVAQLVIAPVLQASFTGAVLDETDRGEGGFGSSGR